MISKRGDFCIRDVRKHQGGALVSSAPTEKSAPMLCQFTYCVVGALLALASGKAERRQVHPLNISYNKSVCEKILHIYQFCRNPQIIRTIKAGR